MISKSGPNEVEIVNEMSSRPGVIEEIVLDDSEGETSEPRENPRAKQNVTSVGAGSTSGAKGFSLLKKNSALRGLLPPTGHETYLETLQLPIVKRCCIEHCYFSRNRPGAFRYNFRPPADSPNTLQFENNDAAEQPTIEIECLAPTHNSVPANGSFDKNNVNGNTKKNSCGSSSCSSKSGRDSSAEDSIDRDCRPEVSSPDSDTEAASIVSCEPGRVVPKTVSPKIIRNGGRNTDHVALNASTNSNRFISFHGPSTKIRTMQKLMKAKCPNEKGKTGKISPPKLKKMMSQRKDENMLKMTEYLFPVPNLGKTSNGEKNWRMEYMDDEVQSLGLDDLLLKASELNAENFTKALGRKLEPVKSGFNSKDSSEIVFTIPKSKKGTEDGGESDGELSKRVNLKTIKLDISKPFFESEKSKETDSGGKSHEEISAKRPGIKVKTVENINEEFKDSLGRLNNSVEKEACSGLEKSNFDVANEEEKETNSQEESEKDAEGSRPFIMTIIQSKTEKQRPAILRNSYLKKKATLEMAKSHKMECRLEDESSGGGKSKKEEKVEENGEEALGRNPDDREGSFDRDLCAEAYVCYQKALEDLESESCRDQDGENRFAVKKRNIPFILNRGRKAHQSELSSLNRLQSKLVKVGEGGEKQPTGEKTFKITSIEQKLGPKEANRRFIKVVPYEPISKQGPPTKGTEPQQKVSEDEAEVPQKDEKVSHMLSLSAFSIMLKEILPDKWFLSLDKKYGLQIIKTHLDEYLNPSILISVVITRCGKVTVNVRGKQLNKSHELFSNLCDISNSENKLSLNYVLGILNKLRHRSVCCGCDNPALKKYWSDGGVVESQTEFQQVFRSHLCQLLVSLGRRRCYPCYRVNESLKKRHRKDKVSQKAREEKAKEAKVVEAVETPKSLPQGRGVKRHLEDFLEESFSTMKQQIVDEIEKNKKLGERESALKAQEEVLSFMGLTRKESLDNPVRKSKRKKNSFFKLQQPVKKKIDQKELEFLEKYWTDINTLFSTSLLFGAYSRTGRSRLREKCKMFQKLLSTWKNIVATNPEWIGEISLFDDHGEGESIENLSVDQFDKMDVPALRAYIINSVKEVNRLKHKLRTRNSYFKVLYNKFVKRRMKRSKALSSQAVNGSSATSTTNTPTPTDFSSDENSRDKEKVGAEEKQGGQGEEMAGEGGTVGEGE